LSRAEEKVYLKPAAVLFILALGEMKDLLVLPPWELKTSFYLWFYGVPN
jgi:hypothetical protein